MQIFTVNSEPQVSYRKSVVTPNSREERSQGASLRFAPFSENSDRLQLSASYLDGQSRLIGTGINYETGFYEEFETSYGGKNWEYTLNSFWLERALWLHGSYARSDFDADGFDTGAPAERDSASNISVQISSSGRLADSLQSLKLQRWTLLLQQQTVGPQFFSLANLSLPGDLQTRQAQLQLAWSQVDIQALFLDSHNDVDDRASIARQFNTQSRLTVNYSPMAIEPDQGIWHWLGQPALSFSVNQLQRDQRQQDALIAGYDLNDTTMEYRASVNFYRDKLQWGLEHSRVDYSNSAQPLISDGFILSQPLSDNSNHFTTLQLAYTPNRYLSLQPSVQWNSYTEAATDTEQTSLSAAFNTQIQIIPNRLSLDASYTSLNQDTSYSNSLFDQRQETEYASLVVNWLAVRANDYSPGVSVSLRGNWNRNDSDFQEYEDYQIFLGFEISWTAGSQQ